MPKLYIGSTEGDPASISNIYNRVISTAISNPLTAADRQLIAGLYFGVENPPTTDGNLTSIVNSFNNVYMPLIASNPSYKIVWIPYLDIKRSPQTWQISPPEEQMAYLQTQFNLLRQFKARIPSNKIVMLVQPGTFFFDAVKTPAIRNRRMSLIYELRDQNTGFQLELDMGLVTGRRDFNAENSYTINAPDKMEMLKEYFAALNNTHFNARNSYPIAIYSGGPNEHGYRNIKANQNEHNNGNHIPYHKGTVRQPVNVLFLNETPYNGFRTRDGIKNSYGGNLIYDINNYIFNGEWNSRLRAFFGGYTPHVADTEIQNGSNVRIRQSARYYGGIPGDLDSHNVVIPAARKGVTYKVDGLRSDRSQVRLQAIN